jgi:hypothetical protein
MKISNIQGVDPPKKLEKRAVDEVRQKSKKVDSSSKDVSQSSKVNRSDQVEISPEAKELQKTRDDIVLSRELLAKLPSSRAHVVYEAIAKIKAGLYSSEEIVEEAATKLMQSGELDDII